MLLEFCALCVDQNGSKHTSSERGRAKCVDKGGGKSAVKRSHCLPPLFEAKIFIPDASTQRDIVDVPPELVIFHAKLLALKK